MKAIFILFFLLSGNLSAQSAHGIGIDLINGGGDQFRLGLRYEYRLTGNHGAKLSFGYSGATGYVFGIGYQYYIADNQKFKIVSGLDYKYIPRNSALDIDGHGNALSIPLEARFLLYKNIWLNVGMSPSWEVGTTSFDRFGLKDLRIGSIVRF